MARLVPQRAQGHWKEIEVHIGWCDQRIAAHRHRDDEQVQRATALKGIGPVTASAMVVAVGDWIGRCDRNSAGGSRWTAGAIIFLVVCARHGTRPFLHSEACTAPRSFRMDRPDELFTRWQVERCRWRQGARTPLESSISRAPTSSQCGLHEGTKLAIERIGRFTEGTVPDACDFDELRMRD